MAERKGGQRPGRAAEQDIDQRTIEVARVTRVMAGGKRMRFRACVVIGNRHGSIGYGVGKGADVSLAISKATTRARKDMIHTPVVGETIPHELRIKFKAARIILKPAPNGTGIVAGGAVREALEISGIHNIVAKVYGSKNKINNIKALFAAFRSLQDSMKKRSALTREKSRKARRRNLWRNCTISDPSCREWNMLHAPSPNRGRCVLLSFGNP